MKDREEGEEKAGADKQANKSEPASGKECVISYRDPISHLVSAMTPVRPERVQHSECALFSECASIMDLLLLIGGVLVKQTNRNPMAVVAGGIEAV